MSSVRARFETHSCFSLVVHLLVTRDKSKALDGTINTYPAREDDRPQKGLESLTSSLTLPVLSQAFLALSLIPSPILDVIVFIFVCILTFVSPSSASSSPPSSSSSSSP